VSVEVFDIFTQVKLTESAFKTKFIISIYLSASQILTQMAFEMLQIDSLLASITMNDETALLVVVQ